MDWSRVKTIMIALLLGVNIFLLITYIRQDNRYRRDELVTRSDVCSILSAQNIEVDETLIPLDSVTIRPAVLENKGLDAKKIASSILGDVFESETDEGNVYTGKAGNALFSQNSFSLVYSAGRDIKDSEEAERLARQLSKRLGLSADFGKLSCEQESGGFSVKIPQSFDGMHVFNYDVLAKISEDGNVIAYGKIARGGAITYTEGRVLASSSLMLEFADAIKDSRKETLKITGIEYGYAATISTPNIISLTPVMRLASDTETFYINAETGEIMNF